MEIEWLAVALAGLATLGLTINRWLALLERLREARQRIDGLERRIGRTMDEDAFADGARVPDDLPPLELVRALAERTCIAFVGMDAELGRTLSGVPDLFETVVRAADPGGRWTDVKEYLDAGHGELVLELLQIRLGEQRLIELISANLDRTMRYPRSAILEPLSQLPFAGVLTNDWTGVVAQELMPPRGTVITPWERDTFDALLRRRRPFLVELRGDVRSQRVLFARRDVREAMDRNRDYGRFLVSLLNTRSLLFVGASLSEVEDFLETVQPHASKRPHWALVPRASGIETAAEILEKRHNLRLLTYRPTSLLEEPVMRFLERLTAALRTEKHRRRARRFDTTLDAPGDGASLSAVRLENVGPFTELSLQLGSRRTVLLGDNGAGKSTILRAIALSLADETSEREQLAQRMLRSGTTSGCIELTFGSESYRTDLRRARSRVDVERSGLTPVDEGLTLVLGFPPLRGCSVRDPAGPQSGGVLLGPAASDLEPLLSPRPDARLDDLKQWIVNTDARAQRGGNRSLYSGMLDRFFKVMQELLPDWRFTFKRVDQVSWQVLLDSPDGEITFDALSQGMISIFGWVGVLIQRLYEVHGEAPEPTHGDALVLIDEIDAHLHPEWQRALLPLLHKHFPGVRLIATTHSPLVVTSIEAGDAIIRLARDDSGQLRAERIARSFRGSTPDEVLTSPAFDMETPLDQQTDRLMREYTQLLARGRTPDNDAQAARLAAELGEPRTARTPHEEQTARLFREWLRSRLADVPQPRRDRLMGEAQRYLDRLHSGEWS
jgi:predicted ATPase